MEQKLTSKIISMTPTKNLVQLSKEGIASILYRKLCAVMYEKWVAIFALQEQQKKRMAAAEAAIMIFPFGFLLYFAIPQWVFTITIHNEPMCRSATSTILAGILSNVFFLRRSGKIWLLSIPIAFFLGFTLSESAYEKLFLNEVNGRLFFSFGIPFLISTVAFFLETFGVFILSYTKKLLAKLPLIGRFFQSAAMTDFNDAYQEALEHAGEAKKADIIRLMREYTPELTEMVDGLKVSEVENEFSMQQSAKQVTLSVKEMTLPLLVGEWLEGDGKGGKKTIDLASVSNLLIGGTRGGGKTNFLEYCICTMLDRGNCQFYISDPLGDLGGYATQPNVAYSAEKEETKAFVATVIRIMHERAKLFNSTEGVRHIRDLKSSDAPPRIFIVIDEYESWADDEQFLKWIAYIARLGRKYGVHMFLSTQTPNVKMLPTVIRANVTTVAFRAESAPHAKILGQPKAFGIKDYEIGKAVFQGFFLQTPLADNTKYFDPSFRADLSGLDGKLLDLGIEDAENETDWVKKKVRIGQGGHVVSYGQYTPIFGETGQGGQVGIGGLPQHKNTSEASKTKILPSPAVGLGGGQEWSGGQPTPTQVVRGGQQVFPAKSDELGAEFLTHEELTAMVGRSLQESNFTKTRAIIDGKRRRGYWVKNNSKD